MSTKRNNSAGTQYTKKGPVQGTSLVDPDTGLPVDVIEDTNGIKRLAVDSLLTASIPSVEVNIESDGCGPDGDSIHIVDRDSCDRMVVNPDGSIDVNTEVDAADGDNIAIHDADGDELDINPDGSINVNGITSNIGDYKSVYSEVTSVASSSLTTIQTYTVPPLKTAFLQKIEVSGSNIAEYTVEINATVEAKKRTYFGNSINTDFIFSDSGPGMPLVAGDITTVKVIHVRPFIGDFNSRIQVIEV